MDTKLMARIGAIIFVAIAITMTAIQLREAPKTGAEPELVMIDEPDADLLRAELVRCSSIGEAGQVIRRVCGHGLKTAGDF